jgi:hypothetical protein
MSELEVMSYKSSEYCINCVLLKIQLIDAYFPFIGSFCKRKKEEKL